MSQEKPKAMIMLPEICHNCEILARATKRIIATNQSLTIPIILACRGYVQETVLTGNFPGREFIFLEKDQHFIDNYLIEGTGAKISGRPKIQGIFGEANICPQGLP